MNAKRIRYERQRADLSLAAVAGVLGRTRSWLSKIESGTITVDKTTLQRIGRAIERLQNLRAMSEKNWDFSDLRLSDPKNRQKQ